MAEYAYSATLLTLADSPDDIRPPAVWRALPDTLRQDHLKECLKLHPSFRKRVVQTIAEKQRRMLHHVSGLPAAQLASTLDSGPAPSGFEKYVLFLFYCDRRRALWVAAVDALGASHTDGVLAGRTPFGSEAYSAERLDGAFDALTATFDPDHVLLLALFLRSAHPHTLGELNQWLLRRRTVVLGQHARLDSARAVEAPDDASDGAEPPGTEEEPDREEHEAPTEATIRQAFEAVLVQARDLEGKVASCAEEARAAIEAFSTMVAPMPDALLQRMNSCAESALTLRTCVVELEQRMGRTIEPPQALQQVQAALASLRDRLEMARGSEALRRDATAVVQRVLLLETQGPAAEALGAVYAAARELLAGIQAGGPAVDDTVLQALVRGEHPLAALGALVGNSSSEEEKDAAAAIVAGAYGGALLRATLAGKLQVVTTPERAAATQGGTAIEAEVVPTAIPHLPESPSADQPPTVQAVPLGPVSLAETASSGTPVAAPAPSSPRSSTPKKRLRDHQQAEEVSSVVPAQPEAPAPAASLCWQLLDEGHVSLAFQLAAAVEAEGGATMWLPPSWLLKAVALAPIVQSPPDEISAEVASTLNLFSESLFVPGAAELNDALRLLALAASLRPALMAPTVVKSAPRVLAALHFDAPLRDYCQWLADQASRGIALDPAVLPHREAVTAGNALAAVRARASEWLKSAPKYNLKFEGATKVWRKWTRSGDGLLSLIVEAVAAGNAASRDKVHQAVERLTLPAELDREIDRADSGRPGRGKRGPIRDTALKQLRQHAHQALDIAREWLSLSQLNSLGRETSKHLDNVHALREQLRTRQSQVVSALTKLDAEATSEAVRSATDVCLRVFAGLEEAVSPSPFAASAKLPAEAALSVGLLSLDGIHLDADWLPREDAGACVRDLLRGDRPVIIPPWRDTFSKRADAGDHVATQLICEAADAGLIELGGGREEWRSLREKSLGKHRESLRRRAGEVRDRVEQGVQLGVILGERERLLGKVDQVELRLAVDNDLEHLKQDLEETVHEVEKARESAHARIAAYLREVGVSPERSRIEELLARGDLVTANEYVDFVRNGLPLPAPDVPGGEFSGFYPETVEQLARWPVRAPADLARSIRAREWLGRADVSGWSDSELEQVVSAIQSWGALKIEMGSRQADDILRHLVHVLEFAGFESVRLSGFRKDDRKLWVDMECIPIRARELCPVFAFGSQADGRYRLLVVPDGTRPEDVPRWLEQDAPTHPALVLVLGRMDARQRRVLGRVTSERRPFIVLDETLFLFLSTRTQARLRTLFDCALPFAKVNPFSTAAGYVPPEVFYGRTEERRSIEDASGSCFIFGGRQLGKTALLREAERGFHSPAKGRVARWIDLKAYGVGTVRSVDEVWNVIATELRKVPELADLPTGSNPDRLINRLSSWLQADRARRILLLLDEADSFLERDGAANADTGLFFRAAKLKNLMDSTDRRFKVVFAGLHNVQRATRLANHPLAHLGTPLCIGPLLAGGEWKQARTLVRAPFEAMGFCFESPDLVTRILSQTNYYPSLVQLYCHELYKHVTRPGQAEAVTGPPNVITARDVEEAYASKDLRQEIRKRLQWTLELDLRYRLIALSIAQETHELAQVATDGFTVEDIRRSALYWWRQGFEADSSTSCFRMLLDEMVGLGVLREAGRGRYALRSDNVSLLIGTVEEVEEELQRFGERAIAPSYDPMLYRRPAGESDQQVDFLRRSPVTAAQEEELRRGGNEVSLVVGSVASGLRELTAFLPALLLDAPIKRLDAVSEVRDFSKALGEWTSRRPDSGFTSLVLDWQSSWSVEWLRVAVARMGQLKGNAATAKVIVLADPRTWWQVLLEVGPGAAEKLRLMGVEVIRLARWDPEMLRTWLLENKVNTPDVTPRALEYQQATGLWPSLIAELAGSVGRRRDRWIAEVHALGEALQQDPLRNSRLADFGLDVEPANRVLRRVLGYQEPMSTDEVVEWVDDLPSQLVVQALEWADDLSLVRPVAEGRWGLDGVVAKLLG